MIMLNDGRYALRCELEKMYGECWDLLEVERNFIVWLMFHSHSCDLVDVVVSTCSKIEMWFEYLVRKFVSWNWVKWCLWVEQGDV